MPVLGLIKHVSGLLYRDLQTGKFLSYEQVKPILDQARQYGFQGAAVQGRLARAADTIALNNDISVQEAREKLADYLTRYKRWQEDGEEGERPDKNDISPEV